MTDVYHQAWIWPLIVEGTMTQATIALISLARPHHTNNALTLSTVDSIATEHQARRRSSSRSTIRHA
ncbi:hypothetical protein BJY24_006535 [Nocardia transvalensis]|uniref:Uncharacterized protein n=1 Tax=Nocardia transvalensis TaxID=37333 RepID=A0A7W9PL05_9NOCA|nr:hypothetical protein [Nocardia transvalensis]MBB5917623.1 hypothetical protein [Nocardia transvalensis]